MKGSQYLRTNFRRYIWSYLVFYFFFSNCGLVNAEKKDIHFTGLFPMSGSYAPGEVLLAATEIALGQINRRDDILKDYNLVVHVNDTQCDTGKGLNAIFWQLYEPPIKTFILGGGCSIVCEPVAKSSQYWNLVQLGWGCSSPALSAKSVFPRFMRTNPPEHLMNGGRLAMMNHFNWKKIAAITQTYSLFTTATGDLAKRMENTDMLLITSELFIQDPMLQIQNIQKHDARIIVLASYEDVAVRVFCEAYKIGLYGAKYVWILPGWYSEKWMEQPLSDCTLEQIFLVLEGTFTTDFVYGNLVEERGIANVTQGECTDLVLDHIGDRNKYMPPTWHTGYDGLWALALALNSSISKLDEIGLKIEDFTYTDQRMADIFLEAVYNTTFLGITGKVVFDSNGDNILTMGIMQTQNGQNVLVGTYNELEDKLEWTSEIIWSGGFVPKDSKIYRVEVMFVSKAAYITMCCFTTIGIIIACLLLVFNITYRKYRLIKMSSPVMNNIILAGCIVSYLTVYSQELSAEFTSVFCKMRTLTVMLGFSLSVGALFAKTWRVYVIFTNKTKKVILKDSRLILIVLVIVSVDIVVFVARELVTPSTLGREVAMTETYDRGDLIVQREILVCKSQHDLYFQSVVYGYKGLMLVFGAFLAWQTRKVNIPALNDSQYIGMCIYNVAVLSILSAILVFALDKQLEMQYVLISAFLIFGTTTVQLIIFIPKVMKIQDMRKQVDEEGSDVNETVTGGTVTGTMNTTVSGEKEDQIKNLQKKNEEAEAQLKVFKNEIKDLKGELAKLKEEK